MPSYYIISSLTGNSKGHSGTCSQENPQPEDTLVKKNELLLGRFCRFIVREVKGEGVFGKVAKCIREDTGEPVAVKILKRTNCLDDVERELEMLLRIRQLDPRKNNLVHFLDSLEHRGHPCLVFEMLDRSLHDVFVERGCRPLPLSVIRIILMQLLQALDALKSIGVIHTDIKMDNIMLVDHMEKPYRVKLIDFGLAIPADHVRRGMTCQPVSYRAPEVVLGLPITEAIDVWSLGCVIACLYLGRNLFNTNCPHKLLSKIIQILDQPRDELLDLGLFTDLYFNKNEDFRGPAWTLMTTEEFNFGSFPKSQCVNSSETPSSLDELMPECENPEDPRQVEDRKAFLHLLEGLLDVEADRRLTPRQAVLHNFTVMTHLVNSVPTSSYAMDAVATLTVWSRIEEGFGKAEKKVQSDGQKERPSSLQNKKRRMDDVSDLDLHQSAAAKRRRGPETFSAGKLQFQKIPDNSGQKKRVTQ
ncbi:homeodomain-interacting protein kinase 1-like [Thalassophryne amazonica]|uniref:homeodomain-interacting protein kinase 1-like n=1 Tax=Thalassophryne amazonica TaxID=390379 RepID=UPI00147244F4|nr:homeodomain-interacting protein kinase 1-like [Thalassophryne amazonica]